MAASFHEVVVTQDLGHGFVHVLRYELFWRRGGPPMISKGVWMATMGEIESAIMTPLNPREADARSLPSGWEAI